MTFRRAIVSSVVQLEFDCENADESAAIQTWKASVLAACNVNNGLISPQLNTIQEQTPPSHMVRMDMPWHITLAYRIDMNSRNAEQDAKLAESLTSFLKGDTEALGGQLLLNPPILSCYPDMTVFPMTPLHRINYPLVHLLKQNYGYSNLYVSQVEDPFRPEEHEIANISSQSQPNAENGISHDTKDALLPTCAIVVLGRALEDGKVTPTLESRLELGMRTYLAEAEACGDSSSSNGHGNHTPSTKPVLIMSGGFTSRELPHISEARTMRNWLQSRYESDPKCKEALKSIIIEEDSLTTIENALYVRRKLLGEDPSLRCVSRLIIATTESHGPRSHYVFRRILQPEMVDNRPSAESSESSSSEPKPKSGHLHSTSLHIELVTCPDADTGDSGIEAWKKGKAWHELLLASLSTSPAFIHSSTPQEGYYDALKAIESDDGALASDFETAHKLLIQHSLHHLVTRNRVQELTFILRVLTSLSRADLIKLMVSRRSFAYQVLPGNVNADPIFMSHDQVSPCLGPLLASIAIEKTRPQAFEALVRFLPSLATFCPLPRSNLISTLSAILIGYRARTGGKAVSAEILSSFLRTLTERIPHGTTEVLPLYDILRIVGAVGLNWSSQHDASNFAAGYVSKAATPSPVELSLTSSKHLPASKTWSPTHWFGSLLYEIFFVPSLLLRLQRQLNILDRLAKETPKEEKAERERRKREFDVYDHAITPVLRSLSSEDQKHRPTLPYIFLINNLYHSVGANKAVSQLESSLQDAIANLPADILQKHSRHVELLVEGSVASDPVNSVQKRLEKLFLSITSRASLPSSHSASSSSTTPSTLMPQYFESADEIAHALAKLRKASFDSSASAPPREDTELFLAPVVFIVLNSTVDSPNGQDLPKELKKSCGDGRRLFQCVTL